jgi:hypothetical protein
VRPIEPDGDGAVKITRAQLRLLRALRAGYRVEPRGSDSIAFHLIAPDGYIDGAVYAKTVSALRASGWMDDSLQLTEAGRTLAVGSRGEQ